MFNFFHYYFDWYKGNVWGNILASVIWSIPLWSIMIYRQEKNHRKAELHRRKIEKHLGIKE